MTTPRAGRIGTVRVDTRRVSAADIERLLPAERSLSTGYCVRRAAQFASGRVLLRALLGTDNAIGRQASGAPRVPRGVRVSLAHDEELAVAAVTTNAAALGIGVDTELVCDLPFGAQAVLAREEERHLDPLTLHVIKEATYKAWSVLGGGLVAPRQIAVNVHDHAFTARVRGSGQAFDGQIARDATRVVAVALAS